ncbi:MAG: SDR family NAD(P)-dependent oxidoreductase [Bacteroidales bacterium]|nr:MAG: SDR family NAD(P)-dependent oxidoreductase [Bacteroidales bacterium]
MQFYTLITGSSSGIGKALATECAARNHNLLLIALPGQDLESISERLMADHGIHADYLNIDLTEQQAAEKVYDWARQNQYHVNILINNAGISFEGPFENHSVHFFEKSMKLNIVALVSLTRLFIDDMKSYPEAHILNLGSVASYFPMPYKAVYSASKIFVYTFSMALREEFRKTGIKISVLAPGPVVTNRHTAKSAIKKGKLARMMHTKTGFVAKYGVDRMLKGKAVIRVGFLSHFVFLVEKILPTPAKLKLAKLIFK